MTLSASRAGAALAEPWGAVEWRTSDGPVPYPEALAAMGPGIDLLMADISLPDGSGVDLAEKVRAQFPDMPVVFATGHRMAPPLENSTVLGKPFGEADLARALGLGT